MTVTLTFDVEEFDFPLERGLNIDFETQLKVSGDGLNALTALLDKHSIKATFYITANYALNKPDTVRSLALRGHEIASHDYYHSASKASDPAGAKKVLEDISGNKVVGYRSPRLSKISTKELAQAGFLYNSSMNPTLIPFRYNNLRKPRTVFSDGNIINYPTSVSHPFRIPLFWISLHVMTLGLYKYLARSAAKKDGHLNLYFHPWEFSNSLREKRFGVPHYISNCSGNKLLDKLDRLITDFISKGYSFATTREYLKIDE